MTIEQVLSEATVKLEKKKIPSADLDAEVLLSHVLKKPREYLFTHSDKPLSTYQLKNLRTLISSRLRHEPVAYLTGHKEFYGLDFIVNKKVLIPRPETESLVETVIKQVKRNTKNETPKTVIADIGTGSGCIAVALKKNLPQIKVIATDKSATALKVARRNAKKHQVKIQFKQGNLLEPVKNLKIDIIVANLPYLKDNLDYPDRKVIKYEPALALKGGPDGLKIYRQFYQQLQQLKNKPKLVYLEM